MSVQVRVTDEGEVKGESAARREQSAGYVVQCAGGKCKVQSAGYHLRLRVVACGVLCRCGQGLSAIFIALCANELMTLCGV